MATKERYIIDTQGNRVGLVPDIAEYKDLLTELAELREREEMRHYGPAHDPDKSGHLGEHPCRSRNPALTLVPRLGYNLHVRADPHAHRVRVLLF